MLVSSWQRYKGGWKGDIWGSLPPPAPPSDTAAEELGSGRAQEKRENSGMKSVTQYLSCGRENLEPRATQKREMYIELLGLKT